MIGRLIMSLLLMSLGLVVRAEGRYAEHSVLREGNWAKIRVPESGFYQLTDALIKKAGFSDASFKRLTFGICTMYSATK